jgi:hypothetical protein
MRKKGDDRIREGTAVTTMLVQMEEEMRLLFHS